MLGSHLLKEPLLAALLIVQFLLLITMKPQKVVLQMGHFQLSHQTLPLFKALALLLSSPFAKTDPNSQYTALTLIILQIFYGMIDERHFVSLGPGQH